MEELRNLETIYNSTAAKFAQYESNEFQLPDAFKEQVKEINGCVITYNKYSAIVKTSGSLKIFMPNQWFYIASYFTDFYNELQKYKSIALSVLDKERLKELNGKQLSEKEKNDIGDLGLSETSQNYLVRFITDYAGWGGAKTIDRGDFYVSPILNCAKLVNSTQSYVADLCAFLSDKEDLVKAIITKGEDFDKQSNNVTGSQKELPLQKIYYGTPGSGKSHKVKELVEVAYPNEKERDKYVFRTTFHPDSDYASFVGCYKPKMSDGAITYEFVPQAFTKAYVQAWNEPEKQVYLIVEEINRGNCAQIFGDLFQLLDRKDGVSEYPIEADDDLRQHLEKELNEVGKAGIANGKIKLPKNLNILATMNTSDQSLFPMDSAFKRRWTWECVPIDYNNPDSGAFTISLGEKEYNWHEFLKMVNELIRKATDSEDKQMGNFFIDGDVDESQFVNKVMFYLWNDVCKEEFGTKNNFFRYYTDSNGTEKEFSFNDLFGADAHNILVKFMVHTGFKDDGEQPNNEESETEVE